MPGYRREMVEITDPEVIEKSGERFHPIVLPSTDSDDEVTGKVFQTTAEGLAPAAE